MTRQPWVPFPYPEHSSHPWNHATPNSPHTCWKAFLLLFLQPLFWQSPSAHGQVRISLNELTPTSLQWLRMANVQSRGDKTTSLGARKPWLQCGSVSHQRWPQVGARLQACTVPSFVKLHPRNLTPKWLWESFPHAQGQINQCSFLWPLGNYFNRDW